MSAHAGMAKLNRSQQDLMVRWKQTRLLWTDSVARNIEQKTLDPLSIDVRHAINAMAQIAGILQKVRNDCQ